MTYCLLDILKENIISNTQQKIKIKEKETFLKQYKKDKINQTTLKLKISSYQRTPLPVICENESAEQKTYESMIRCVKCEYHAKNLYMNIESVPSSQEGKRKMIQ